MGDKEREEMLAAEKSWNEATNRRNVASEAHFKTNVLPKMIDHVGTCYRATNSTSSEDPWDLFARVIGVKDERFVVLEVQRTSSGRIEIRTHHLSCYGEDRIGLEDGGFEQISYDDWCKGVDSIIGELKEFI